MEEISSRSFFLWSPELSFNKEKTKTPMSSWSFLLQFCRILTDSIEVNNNLLLNCLYTLHMLFLEESEDPQSQLTSGTGTFVHIGPKQSMHKMCVLFLIIQISWFCFFLVHLKFRGASNISLSWNAKHNCKINSGQWNIQVTEKLKHLH
jgi:hypothetical protein